MVSNVLKSELMLNLINLSLHAKDVNECQDGSSLCTHNCVNNAGSYTCNCRSGYRLHSNGYSCNGIPVLFAVYKGINALKVSF